MAAKAHGSVQALPADLFHLLSAELAIRSDFATLYNCILSSKQLASAGAISALYRISHESPVRGGGSEGLSFAEQDVNTMKWSILWRTIILSALGGTLYPYCRHLRMLDLRDLRDLLEQLDEVKFRGKVAKQFFAGKLSKFHFVYDKSVKWRAGRLDGKKIMLSVGDEVTQHAPLLEGLSEPTSLDMLTDALPQWIPRLGYLQELELWDGKALADKTLRDLLHIHCPRLNKLRIHHSSDPDSDHHFADLIGGMQENTLTYFENISSSSVRAETFLALNRHGKSLRQLKLALTAEGILDLGLLKGCHSLKMLAISSLAASVDLKATQNDVYLEVVEWLKTCQSLEELSFFDMVSAPDLILPVLLNSETKLQKLQINANESSMYVVKDHHDFHRALSEQPNLVSLYLRADPDPLSRDDIEILMNAFCSLKNLRELNLTRISDYFTDEHITLLAQHLPQLEDVYVGGYGISDAVLGGLAQLRKLKNLTFSGITTFTVEGLLDFVNSLGEGNQGLMLSVEMADADNMLTQEAQDLVRDSLATKADGKFEYQPLRDPNVPEFDQSDSD